MPDLDALRARGWRAHGAYLRDEYFAGPQQWTASASRKHGGGTAEVYAYHPEGPSLAEAMLLAACAAADGLPTARERVVESLLREAYETEVWPADLPERIKEALNPTKEAP